MGKDKGSSYSRKYGASDMTLNIGHPRKGLFGFLGR
jgi:hypothetical protein